MSLSLRRRKKEPVERIWIKSEVASTVVILANPDLGLKDLSEKLVDIQDMGYNLNQRFRATPLGVFSKGLSGFLGRLEMGGYTRNGDFRNASSLREEGVDLFEREILEHYLARPEIIQRFASDAGLDLMPIFQKHLREYLKLKRF